MWQVDSANCSFLTNKDIHASTSDKTTNRKQNRQLLFSEIATPTVIKLGSHFLSFCCSNVCSALWVRMKDTTGTSSDPSPCPPLRGAGSQLSHFHHIHNYTFSSLCKTLHHPLAPFHNSAHYVWFFPIKQQQRKQNRILYLWRRLCRHFVCTLLFCSIKQHNVLISMK